MYMLFSKRNSPVIEELNKLSIFIRMKRVQSSKIFSALIITAYMPHLSLLYEDISEVEKDKAVEKVKALVNDIDKLEFEVSTLALYRTDTEDKTLQSWELVADRKLGDGSQ